jgi:hypothetical protein
LSVTSSAIVLGNSQLRLSQYRHLGQPTPRNGARRADAVGSAIEPKSDFDVGLNDSLFNDWNTLLFLFLAGSLGFLRSISGIDPSKDT